MTNKTNIGLVEYAKELLTRETIYILGGLSRPLTASMIDSRISRGCQHTIRNESRIRQGIGKFAYDCNAIMKCYLWEISPGKINYDANQDLGSRTLYNLSREKGNISDMPDIPGLLVWTNDLGHVGVYVGEKDGVKQYVEATPAWGAWGVTTSADKDHPQGHNRKWTFWGKYHLIDYIEEPKPETIKNSYTVVRGDTLYKIASKFKTTTSKLYDANKDVIGPNRNLILPGQVLTIPDKQVSTEPIYHVVERHDTLYKIGLKYGVQWSLIYKNNREIIGSRPSLIKPGMRLFIK